MPYSKKLAIYLENSTEDTVFAYVTGRDISKNGALFFLLSDGKSIYHPVSPPAAVLPQHLEQDVAILLEPRGVLTRIDFPPTESGRIWFSRGLRKLTFLRNPSGDGSGGAVLVEPSVLNASDPNIDIDFSFFEITFNDYGVYANISYVDFVSRLPICLQLMGPNREKEIQMVPGMDARGFELACSKLRKQAEIDGWPWDKLIVPGADGAPLRILSPVHVNAAGASFDGYYEDYVDRVWDHYRDEVGGHTLQLNTKMGAGIVHGRVDRATRLLTFSGPGAEAFHMPSTADILTCATGTFAIQSTETGRAIIPRLAAAFHRSTLLTSDIQPSGDQNDYYKTSPTNHYSRIVHEVNVNHTGYAFPYDDVQPDDGADQSGKVNLANPVALTVSVGGALAFAHNSPLTGRSKKSLDPAIFPVGRKSSKSDPSPPLVIMGEHTSNRNKSCPPERLVAEGSAGAKNTGNGSDGGEGHDCGNRAGNNSGSASVGDVGDGNGDVEDGADDGNRRTGRNRHSRHNERNRRNDRNRHNVRNERNDDIIEEIEGIANNNANANPGVKRVWKDDKLYTVIEPDNDDESAPKFWRKGCFKTFCSCGSLKPK